MPFTSSGEPSGVQIFRYAGAEGQDDEIEQQEARDRVDVHHAPIREELAEVAPHVSAAWRIRRAQIDEQNTDRIRFIVP